MSQFISGSFFKRSDWLRAAGNLFIFLLVLISTKTSGQSFYYFEAHLGDTSATHPPVSIFLNVGADGTAEARVRYKKAIHADEFLVKQLFTDSSASAFTYLNPISGVSFMQGISDTGYVPIRILFQKQSDSLNFNSYYTPFAIEYKENDTSWLPAILIVNKEKSYKTLLDDKDFVKRFYNENENFFTYLTSLNARGLNEEEQRTKFYLIAVANTKDATVGVSAQKDLNKVRETFTIICKQLGIAFIPVVVSGDSFNKFNVSNALDSIKPSARDIVFFYYSGHGFRYPDDKSKYPRISLRTNRTLQLLNENNYELEEVYNRLLKKGARVTIVIGDCCNEEIDAPFPVGKDILRPRAGGIAGLKLNLENCRTLFFPKDQPIRILVGSAEVNQLASGNPELGGFFTNFFQAELVKTLYTNEVQPSWLRIFINARESTRKQALTALCEKGFNGRCVQRAEIKVLPAK